MSITSLNNFISQIENDYKDYKGSLWYRGQPNKDYKLLPSIFRDKKGIDEKELLNILNKMPVHL